jgi:hypothetical protein
MLIIGNRYLILRSLDFHRNGVVYVEDLKGMKLKSFGMQNSKEVSNALMVTPDET